ncbi:MAG: hypothetical protein A2V86_04285 [Deltaproteobacteria bacterium RBG_16_49_23]|nr:MAG: hypothetical protein A2V86_04285 [Deltaproteobacteria bacterium RBG_16_49_23]
MDKWDLLGILCGLALIGSGIRGVMKRKSINKLAPLIISVGQIGLGVFVLIATILFIIKGTR